MSEPLSSSFPNQDQSKLPSSRDQDSSPTEPLDLKIQRSGKPQHLEQGLLDFEQRKHEPTSTQRDETVSVELTPAMECLRLLAAYRHAKQPGANQQQEAAESAQFGRFRILSVLGQGGYGIVFRAHDSRLNREVALKMPRPDSLWTLELQKRFLYEGQATAILDHPNINPVYEAGEVDGVAYLAAAYCSGPSLAKWLKQRDELIPIPLAVELIAKLADGVGYAHSCGVLHRDLKPGNILLNPGPESPRITDFGLARLSSPSEGSITLTGELVGTLDYMAPEQAAGDNRKTGTHSDIYALGVILYELLTGSRPVAKGERVEMIRQITAGEIPRPVRNQQRLPRDLESICMKSLEKDYQDRYRSAEELAEDLRRFLANEPVMARPPKLGRLVKRWIRRYPATATFFAVMLMSLCLVAVLIVQHNYELNQTNAALQSSIKDADAQRDQARQQEKLANLRQEETRLISYAAQVRLASQLRENRQFGLMSEVLSGLGPQPKEVDHRDFTWRVLWDQARNDHWLRGHQRRIIALKFDDNGRHLYSVSEDQTIRIWDFASGTPVDLIKLDTDIPATSFAVSDDGNRLALSFPTTDDQIRLEIWDRATHQRVATLDGLSSKPGSSPKLEFLDNNCLVIAGVTNPQAEDKHVALIWDWPNGQQSWFLPGDFRCNAMAISPQRDFIAIAYELNEDKKCRVDLITVAELNQPINLSIQEQPLNDLQFSRDSRKLGAVGDKLAGVVWSIPDKKQILEPLSTEESVLTLQFLDQGTKFVTFTQLPKSTYFRKWVRDTQTGTAVEPSVDLEGNPREVSYHPSQEFFAVSHVALLRLIRDRQKAAYSTIMAHKKEVWDVRFSHDGTTVFTCSDDGTLASWDLSTFTKKISSKGNLALISCLAVSPQDDWIVSGGYNKQLKVWNAKTGELLRTFKGHQSPVRGVAISPDGRQIASVGRDHTTRLWDAKSGKELAVWEDHSNDVRGVAFTSDGKQLVTCGNDHKLVIRDLKSHHCQIIESPSPIWCMVLTPDDSQVILGGADGILRIADLTTGKMTTLPSGHTLGIMGIALSPDGRTLATAGRDKSVRLWHLPTGAELCVFHSLQDVAHAVAFSPDGTTLAAAIFDGSVLLWQAPELPAER